MRRLIVVVMLGLAACSVEAPKASPIVTTAPDLDSVAGVQRFAHEGVTAYELDVAFGNGGTNLALYGDGSTLRRWQLPSGITVQGTVLATGRLQGVTVYEQATP